MRTEYTCPLELVHDMIKGKWKPIILWRLRFGATSLVKLERDIDGITQKMLLEHLRELMDYTAMITSAMICIVLMVCGLLFCDSLLGMINTPEELLGDSKIYLDIYILGLPFAFFYNIATGIFSALGESKTPFYFLAASSTSNIAVDILFVTVFHMGVAAVKLNNLVITSFTTLGNGISNYTAQNIGAGKLPRIREGFKAGIKMVWMLSAPLFVLYFFAGKWILYAFIDEPTALTLQTGIEFLRILSPFYFVISMKFVADGILRGAGMMGKFMVTTFLDLILRVGIAVLLSRTILGAAGIWCAWPIGWIVAVILSLAFYKSGRWNDLEKVESGKKVE